MVAIPSVLSGLNKLRTLTGSQDKGLMALERADKFLRRRARDLEGVILDGEILYSTFNRKSFLTVLTVVDIQSEDTDTDSYSMDSDAEAEAPADGERAVLDSALPEAHDADRAEADDELPIVDVADLIDVDADDELPVVDIMDILDVVQPGPPPATVAVEVKHEEEVDLPPGN